MVVPYLANHRHFSGAGFFESILHRNYIAAAEFGEDVLFGGEVIEKCSFTYIGFFGDVLDGSFQETTLGK